MAGFRTHITISAACGVGYAIWGNIYLSAPTGGCAVAGGLCAISGMLPDLDSDSGIPARETIGFAAAIVPMVLVDRFRELGVSLDQVVLIGAPLYLLLRFGVGSILSSLTVHRGMFHSIPAMVIAGMIAYLLLDSHDHTLRVFKAAGVSVGYLSHLMLDEIWSVQFAAGVPRVKKSFGTALKFFGDNAGANSCAYGILLILGMTVLREEAVMRSAGLAISRDPMQNQTPTQIPQAEYGGARYSRPAPGWPNQGLSNQGSPSQSSPNQGSSRQGPSMQAQPGSMPRPNYVPNPRWETPRPNESTRPRSAEEDPEFRPKPFFE